MKLQLHKWRLSTLTFREQFLMVGSYCLVVLVLFNLVYQPKSQEAEQLKTRLATIKNEVETLSTTLREYEEKVKFMSTQEDGVRSAGPDISGKGESRISFLIRQIGGMAAEAGVELISVKPSVLEETDRFLMWLIEIDTRSRFKNLLHYLERMENATDPIAVTDIQMETSIETSPMLSSRLIAKVRLWRDL